MYFALTFTFIRARDEISSHKQDKVCIGTLDVLSSTSPRGVELLLLLRAARATRRVIMKDFFLFVFSAPRLDISAQT